ncbi:MAG: hypothetical protein R6X13_09780 [bacterium]
MADQVLGRGPGCARHRRVQRAGLAHRVAHLLRDVAISGEALYYLAAAPELAETSGRFFHLTIDEKPAKQALDRELGRSVWSLSLEMTGLKPGL